MYTRILTFQPDLFMGKCKEVYDIILQGQRQRFAAHCPKHEDFKGFPMLNSDRDEVLISTLIEGQIGKSNHIWLSFLKFSACPWQYDRIEFDKINSSRKFEDLSLSRSKNSCIIIRRKKE